MRSHSTKYQLKEKSLDAIFILSNTLRALLLFKNSEKFRFSVVCVRQFLSRAHSAFGTFLSASSYCLEHHTLTWPLPGVGGTMARPRRSLPRRRDLPWRLTGGKNGGSTPFRAAQRSLALRVASCTPAHPRCTVAVARQPWTRSLPPTDPRRPVPTKACPKLLIQVRLASKRTQ